MFRSSENALRSSRRWALILAVGSLASLSALSGCERADPNQRVLNEISRKIETLTVGGRITLPSLDYYQTSYGELSTKLKGLTDPTSNTQAASIAILSARAQAGLAEVAAVRGAELEHVVGSKVVIARSMVDQWVGQQSIAAALESYDPAVDLANLDAQIAERTKDAQGFETKKLAKDAEIAKLQDQIAQAKTQANTHRSRENDLRKQGEGLSQVAKEDVLRQAIEASRAADALERQSSLLVAQMDNNGPESTELKNQAERFRTQVDLLNTAKAELKARVAANLAQAKTARQEATTAGTQISAALADIAKLNEELQQKLEQVQQQFSSAVKLVKTAGQKDDKARSLCKALEGQYNQAMGDAINARVRVLKNYQDTLDRMAQVRPELPAGAQARDLASKLAQQATDLRAAAFQAYADAGTAYSATGSTTGEPTTQENKDRLTHLSEALKEMGVDSSKVVPPTEQPGTESAHESVEHAVETPADAPAAPEAPVAPEAPAKP